MELLVGVVWSRVQSSSSDIYNALYIDHLDSWNLIKIGNSMTSIGSHSMIIYIT